MKNNYKILAWDSAFFGFKVAQILQPESVAGTLAEMKEADVELAYLASPIALPIQSEFYHAHLVDQKVVFEKKTQQRKTEAQIQQYSGPTVPEQLIQLSIESGRYSRFNTDSNIPKEKFEALYTLWMENSISKKFAKAVLVYKQDQVLVGVITIGEKDRKAAIGIIAVDAAYRRRCIGKALLKAAENWAFQQQYKTIQVVTQVENISACSLYEQLGYQASKPSFFYHLWRRDVAL